MEFRNLGKTGLKVSALCMGTMQFGWTVDEAGSYDILNAAFHHGINFYDTADVYSRWAPGNPGGVAEMIIGNWIKKNGIPRDQLVIATKVRGKMGDGANDEGLSRKHIIDAVENSLRRLQVQYIDLYQTHFFDVATPIEETLRALDDLVHQGKVRYVGCSNYPAWRLMQALWTSERWNLSRYDSLQPHYNLIHRGEFERELADLCRTYGIGVIPYSPLAGGFLTGKYRKGQPLPESQRASGVQRNFSDQNFALIDRLEAIGKDLGQRSVSQMALAWLIANPLITSPIIGPRSLDQLQDNLGAVAFQLNGEQVQELNELSAWQ